MGDRAKQAINSEIQTQDILDDAIALTESKFTSLIHGAA